MKPLSAIEFRNRPLQVKVLTYCDPCQTLKEDVAPREHKAFYPVVYEIKKTCCAECFDAAKKKAAEEARELYASYC